MGRAALVATLVLLAPVACSKGANTPSVPQPRIIESADAGLRVTVPPGATDREGEIAIEVLDALPGELGSDKGTAYDLKPDGLTFTKPVLVERMIDAKARGVDLTKGVPLIILASKSGGKWSVLDDLNVRLDDGTIVVSGTTTHFSSIVAIREKKGATARLDPAKLVLHAPSTWHATGTLVRNSGQTSLEYQMPTGTGTGVAIWVEGSSNPSKDGDYAAGEFGTWRCDEVGQGTYTMNFIVTEDPDVYGSFLPFGPDIDIKITIDLTGEVKCTADKPRPIDDDDDDGVPELKGGTVEVQHGGYNGFPSSSIWALCFDKPVDGTMRLEVTGMNDGKSLTGTVTDGRVRLEGGLRRYGPLSVEKAELTADGQKVPMTEQVKDYVGALEVTSTEGVIAGNADDCM